MMLNRSTVIRITLGLAICIILSIAYLTKQSPVQLDGMDSIFEHRKATADLDDTELLKNRTENTEMETRQVAFLKVHKTGSSTTQNIFLRFGVYRNLTFLLASVKNNECGGSANCISYYNTITDNNTWPPPKNKGFDIMCSHVIYNRQSFKKYLPVNTKYIGIVREPIKRLESAIRFFGLLKNTPLSTYAHNPIQYNHIMLNNRMAFEFGFNKSWFPYTNNITIHESVRKTAADYIKQVSEEFNIILVTEMYEDTLVLMRRILQWTTKDILYKYKGKQNNRIFAFKDAITLKDYLYFDYLLYNFAVKELRRKINLAGDNFLDEVKYFKTLIQKVTRYCLGTRTPSSPPLIVLPSAWHGRFSIEWTICNDMNKREVPFIKEIRKRQYGNMTRT